jgi:hypothetical protein
VPYAPHGAVDGMVCDTTLAENMTFVGKFGSSCNIPFYKDKYCKENIQFSNICYFLKDRPSQPWTSFQVHNFDKKSFDKYLNITKKDKKDHISEIIKVKGKAQVELKIDTSINYFINDENNNINKKYYTDKNMHYIPSNLLIQSFPPKIPITNEKKYLNAQTKAVKKQGKNKKNKSFNKTKKNKKK